MKDCKKLGCILPHYECRDCSRRWHEDEIEDAPSGNGACCPKCHGEVVEER